MGANDDARARLAGPTKQLIAATVARRRCRSWASASATSSRRSPSAATVVVNPLGPGDRPDAGRRRRRGGADDPLLCAVRARRARQSSGTTTSSPGCPPAPTVLGRRSGRHGPGGPVRAAGLGRAVPPGGVAGGLRVVDRHRHSAERGTRRGARSTRPAEIAAAAEHSSRADWRAARRARSRRSSARRVVSAVTADRAADRARPAGPAGLRRRRGRGARLDGDRRRRTTQLVDELGPAADPDLARPIAGPAGRGRRRRRGRACATCSRRRRCSARRLVGCSAPAPRSPTTWPGTRPTGSELADPRPGPGPPDGRRASRRR